MSTGKQYSALIFILEASPKLCLRWDFATSVEEVMMHLHALVMARKVLYLGASDTPAWVVVKANECEYLLDSIWRYSSLI